MKCVDGATACRGPRGWSRAGARFSGERDHNALARIRRQRPDDLCQIGEWPAIIGFRNILIHAYDHVEDAVVWGIVTEQLPRFMEQLEAIPGIDSLSDQ